MCIAVPQGFKVLEKGFAGFRKMTSGRAWLRADGFCFILVPLGVVFTSALHAIPVEYL